MQEVYENSRELVGRVATAYRRAYMDRLIWTDRLIFVLGARGVGKTTLILKRMQEQLEDKSTSALYISMDDLLLSQYRLIDIAKHHFNNGGTHLYIDEVHRYDNWSQELKNVYDKYNKLHLIVSGSSILEINKGKADLSRRAVPYYMPGLSLREYIEIETGRALDYHDLDDILTHHADIAASMVDLAPLQYLPGYLQHGYYPIYLEGKETYHRKLNNVLNLILDVDMPLLLGVDITKVRAIKKLLYILSSQVPLQPNISKLAASIEINRNTLTSYLHYLEQASILRLLWSEGKSYSIMSRPDKVYMHNSNLLHLAGQRPNIGTLRETFVANQLAADHDLVQPKAGDLLVDGKYTIEIGGPSKSFKQIIDLPNSYIAADDTVVGYGKRVPLWLFGFLY